MSDLFKVHDPFIKDLKTCLECGKELKRDIFTVQEEKKRKMIEANACHACNIIYEVFPE
jgi:predicted RNA-binding protein with RPS1 domain